MPVAAPALMAWAAVASALAGAGSLAYGIKSGQDQADAQAAALKKQNQAQQTAEGQALSTERQSVMAQNQANMKTPDVSAILARAASMAKGGVGGTMLTGAQGVNPNTLGLGKTSLLGS